MKRREKVFKYTVIFEPAEGGIGTRTHRNN